MRTEAEIRAELSALLDLGLSGKLSMFDHYAVGYVEKALVWLLHDEEAPPVSVLLKKGKA
jgi:hypothetical protein